MKTLAEHLSERCQLAPNELGLQPGTPFQFDNDCFHLQVEVFRHTLHIINIQAYRQGDGYGRAVVEAPMSYGRATNRMVVVTSPLETAESFWQHLGFVEHPHNPDHMIPEGYAALLAA